MKVLVVGTGGRIVSGISVAADQMARTLDQMGVEVVRAEAGVRRRRRPGRPTFLNAAAALSDAARIAWKARRTSADVVWYHTFGLPALPAARAILMALAARIAGSRSVTHVHAYGLEDWLAQGGLPLRCALRCLGRVSDRIVVLYPSAADVLRSEAGLERVCVLENWVDAPVSPAPLPPGSPFVVCFVGGLIARKGIYELLEATRSLADLHVRVSLVGSAYEDGPHAQRALEESAADLLRSGQLVMRGELPPDGVRDELRNAHAFVLPTRAEGLPLAMLEAMAEGRPVIVGDAGDIRRTVEEAGAGLVLSEASADAVSRAVRQLIADPHAREAMGQRGHRYTEAVRERAAAALMVVLAGVVPTRHGSAMRQALSGHLPNYDRSVSGASAVSPDEPCSRPPHSG